MWDYVPIFGSIDWSQIYAVDKYYLDEVHEDVSKTLHIIPSALLDTKVGVDAGVSGCAR